MKLFSKGVVLIEVRPASAAQRLGFASKDIIRRINDIDIRLVAQLKRILSKNSKRWNITIERAGKILSMTVNR
jgi:S1-C subfamily serine protease